MTYGRRYPVAVGGYLLVCSGASPVFDHRPAGDRVLRLHSREALGPAPEGPTRPALRPAPPPAGQTFEILVRAMETSALHRGRDSSHFIFAGFIILVIRTGSLMTLGIFGSSAEPAVPSLLSRIYSATGDYAATVVLICMVVAAFRRLVLKPARYAVPARYGDCPHRRCRLPSGPDRDPHGCRRPL